MSKKSVTYIVKKAAKYVPYLAQVTTGLNNITFLYTNASNKAIEEKLREWTREAHLTFVWGGKISPGCRQQLYCIPLCSTELQQGGGGGVGGIKQVFLS